MDPTGNMFVDVIARISLVFPQVIKEEVVDCLQQQTKMLQDLRLSMDKLRRLKGPVVGPESNSKST